MLLLLFSLKSSLLLVGSSSISVFGLWSHVGCAVVVGAGQCVCDDVGFCRSPVTFLAHLFIADLFRSQEWQMVPMDEKRHMGLSFDHDGEFW